ncbi:putative sodium-coupled monocarboxylate transporter 1 [Apostichopus japonicus]|uniref:Putative sodium-coupled monocarboxylate transporter 1 n=1 Tax=Stichopus japonicus TaxID=307972 RepID=A0A2G8LQU2_STIJA|nr:putative sodium-coupled monocarboxylate transporter 1 [Apostichopus japonicus]
MATPEYTLGVWDYVILVGLLLFSAAIGVFHALRGGKQKDSKEYFLGNRKMGAFPVSMSIIVSVMSAVTYIGTPAEVYRHGPMYWLMSVNKIVGAGLVTTCFLPVFYNLEITSVYEYIDMRFNKFVRYGVILADCSYTFIYMGIVMYTPALALSTVTGITLTGSILAIGLVCTFYTAIGGIKAVIWTDVLQALVMFSGLLIISIAVCIDIGGASEVWRRAEAGNRTDLLDFNIDPTLRYSFWTVMLGGTVSIVSSVGVKQSFVQRESVSLGQLIPLLIVDLFHTVPGLPGLLIAGAFSASLSSVSSLVNALAAITGQDIVKTIWKDIPEARYTLVVKLLSAFYGLSAIGVAFIASKLGDIIQAVLSFGGIFSAPILGVFTLGLLCPRANSKGAFVGLLLGVAVGITLKVGSGYFPPSHAGPPLSVSECDVTTTTNPLLAYSWTSTSNVTSAHNDVTNTVIPQTEPFPATKIFSVSFLHYNTIDWLVTVLVGLMVSYLTGATDPATIDPKLLSPVVLNVFSCCWPSKGGTKLKDTTIDAVKEERNTDMIIEEEHIKRV